jgi:hypothetical protein
MRTAFEFSGGAAVVLLVLNQPTFFELAVLGIILCIFWNRFGVLTSQVITDMKVRSLRKRLANSLHVDGDARTAYLLLVERRLS